MLALGNNYLVQKKYDSALKLYSECMELLDKTDLLRASVHFSMGKLKCLIEKYDEALHFFCQTLSIREAAFGRNDTRVARVLLCLGMVHFLANHNNKAQDFLNDFVRICDGADKASTRKNDLKQLTTHFLLAQIILGDLQYKSNPQEALEMWNTASDLCEGEKGLDLALGDMVVRRLRLSVSREKTISLDSKEKAYLLRCLFVSLEPNY